MISITCGMNSNGYACSIHFIDKNIEEPKEISRYFLSEFVFVVGDILYQKMIIGEKNVLVCA